MAFQLDLVKLQGMSNDSWQRMRKGGKGYEGKGEGNEESNTKIQDIIIIN